MNTPRPTILVIDDDEDVRQSFIYYLEDLNYKVLAAENGQVGLELFEHQGADLVLVDLRMPEMDGLEVLAHITYTSPDTPQIVVSGTGVISDAVEALHRGAWDYLLKPIEDLSVLAHVVETSLEKSRLKRENRQYQEHLEQMVAKQTQELKQANAHLQENELQFRSILDNIQTGIVIVEMKSLKIVYANPTAGRMAGKPVEEIVNSHCRDIFGPIGESGWTFSDPDQGIESLERFMITADKKQIPILTTINHTVYRDRECLLASIFDLSEQKRAEADKAALETHLRRSQKMEALGTLAGGIAHDFNNILGAIIGYAELCYLDLDDPDHPFYQRLKSILHAANRAKELVAQILTFSRIQEHILTPVSIAPIVKEALKLLNASLPAHIELTQRIASYEQVLADPAQIHQVIMNLCTNAYHAMEEKGGLLTVSLCSVVLDRKTYISHANLPPGNYLELIVADTGTGMSAAVLEKIFDPYFTTKDKNKGTGLGLSVVHGIVKSYAGAITVNSTPGKGTSVHVLLPATDESAEIKEGTPNRLPRGSEKIILVDDEKDLVDIGSQMLDKLGYDVTGVVGSLEALKIFKQSPQRFDLVITDLNMPTMAGNQLTEEMIRIRPDIPIIICTGFSERFDEKRARMLGVRKVIMKPMAVNILAQAVRDVLDES